MKLSKRTCFEGKAGLASLDLVVPDPDVDDSFNYKSLPDKRYHGNYKIAKYLPGLMKYITKSDKYPMCHNCDPVLD